MAKSFWTPERDRLLAQLRPTTLIADIAHRLGCSANTVSRRIREKGLRDCGPGRHWSLAEETRLAELWQTHTKRQLAALFGRPIAGIAWKIGALGLDRKIPGQPWGASVISEPADEPDYGIQVEEIAPGHRRVTFGRTHHTHGQLNRTSPRGACSLWNLYG